ncbi:hypothetical protein SAMN04488044_3281 [Cognatishimia maritima]|uniref:Uncharacterized protein n=1 Tax=Cognatishimia maritima TaxID=870908 RepID=A0A1M5VVG4_9RHOB|nr:hypothetical protein SAMN04488044_3281 [Cognatishimia maritima]
MSPILFLAASQIVSGNVGATVIDNDVKMQVSIPRACYFQWQREWCLQLGGGSLTMRA